MQKIYVLWKFSYFNYQETKTFYGVACSEQDAKNFLASNFLKSALTFAGHLQASRNRTDHFYVEEVEPVKGAW